MHWIAEDMLKWLREIDQMPDSHDLLCEILQCSGIVSANLSTVAAEALRISRVADARNVFSTQYVATTSVVLHAFVGPPSAFLVDHLCGHGWRSMLPAYEWAPR